MTRMLCRVSTADTAVFLCDIQEKFRASTPTFAAIVETSRRVYEAARILNVPVLVTEQYPKGLGQTVAELNIDRTNVPVYEKTCFSMIIPKEQLRQWKTRSVVLCGIEAHACIYHTAIDLLENGYTVHVVADACSSRSQSDRMYAFRQIERAGAHMTTCELVLLSFLRGADHPKFKQVQALIKDPAPDSGLAINSFPAKM